MDYAILLDGERVARVSPDDDVRAWVARYREDHAQKRGKAIDLKLTPSGKLARAERAGLDTEAERIGAFLGLEPVLTVE